MPLYRQKDAPRLVDLYERNQNLASIESRTAHTGRAVEVMKRKEYQESWKEKAQEGEKARSGISTRPSLKFLIRKLI